MIFHKHYLFMKKTTCCLLIFSSPEPKAQVSFSDQNLSVVRRRCRCCRCRKLFTFSSSSPEPLGQFQPNLAQSILGWREIVFVQTKSQIIVKIYWQTLKIVFSRTKPSTKHPYHAQMCLLIWTGSQESCDPWASCF